MTTPLTPPPERDLPPARRQQIRGAVLQAASPTRSPRRRGWVLPLAAAAAAVAALVLGLGLPRTGSAPVVSNPTAAAPSLRQTPSLTTSSSPEPTQAAAPRGVATDRGPLTTAQTRDVVDRCRSDLDRTAGVDVLHFARRTAVDGDVVLFTDSNGLSLLCTKSGSSTYDGDGSKTRSLPAPTGRRPLVRILNPGLALGGDEDGNIYGSTGTAYRVASSVVSLQMRISIDGHTSPWFEAAIHDGYAYAAASIKFTTSKSLGRQPDYTIQDRAYNSAGDQLKIDRTPR